MKLAYFLLGFVIGIIFYAGAVFFSRTDCVDRNQNVGEYGVCDE